MMDDGAVRNLERIQEDDGATTPRTATWALVVAFAAAAAFAALALGGHKSEPTPKGDPLGDLVRERGKTPPRPDLAPRDVTFPGLLSDRASPTTALAAVSARGNASDAGVDDAVPPPATDRLSVVPLAGVPGGLGATPLPAQNVLLASPVVARPRDPLTRAASDAAHAASDGAAHDAAAGHEGGYQLQVSSFRTEEEANNFAGELRARGHKAYVQEAHVEGRGTWFRVRIGPFASAQLAKSYRTGFEAKEHVVPFVVPPSTDGGATNGAREARDPRDAREAHATARKERAHDDR